MYKISFKFFAFIAFVVLSNAETPPYITKCKSDDAKCLKESTQAAIPVFADGIPEKNVEKLDPLFFDKIDGSSPNLNFILSNVTIKGLRDCRAKKVQRNAENSKIIIKVICTATIDGNYDMKGQIILLPIDGKGHIHIVLKSLEINVELDIVEKTNDDGKVYWHVKSWQHSFDLKDKSVISFKRTDGGNDDLIRAVEELITKSGNDVIKEVGKPMIKVAASRVVHNVKNMFKTTPVEDLTLS